MQKGRRTGGLAIAEICAAVCAAAVVAGLVATGALCAEDADPVRVARAAAASAAPHELNRDGLSAAVEIVRRLKVRGLLPLDYSPLDPWGRRYVIVLGGDRETSAHPG